MGEEGRAGGIQSRHTRGGRVSNSAGEEGKQSAQKNECDATQGARVRARETGGDEADERLGPVVAIVGSSNAYTAARGAPKSLTQPGNDQIT